MGSESIRYDGEESNITKDTTPELHRDAVTSITAVRKSQHQHQYQHQHQQQHQQNNLYQQQQYYQQLAPSISHNLSSDSHSNVTDYINSCSSNNRYRLEIPSILPSDEVRLTKLRLWLVFGF